MLTKIRIRRVLSSSHFGVRNAQVFAHLLFVVTLGTMSLGELGVGLVFGVVLFNLGHSIGAHRFFSHCQFSAGPIGRIFLNLAFTLNMWGSAIGYGAVHILHHIHSDTSSDPHNPNSIGKLRLWLWTPEMRVHVPTFKRLFACRINRFFHNYYFLIHAAYVLILAALSWKVVLLFWCIPIVVCYHLGKVQTVLAHVKSPFGRQTHATGDTSQNLIGFKLLLWGDELHNNHHLDTSAVNLNFASNLLEFDPNYWIIRLLFDVESRLQVRSVLTGGH